MQRSLSRRLGAATLVLLPLAGCGGGSQAAPDPVPTSSPTSSPVALHAVGVIVFYDENENGRLDRDEEVRVPNVTVAIAGRTGVTDKDHGRAVLPAVPAGPQEVVVASGGLPPFFLAGAPLPTERPAYTLIHYGTS